MKTFSRVGAKHFAAGFAGSATTQNIGMDDYIQTLGAGIPSFSEGSAKYSEFRDCLLRESERSLLLSNNCFIRSLNAFRPSASYWSLVGLYYSSFLAAKAILGMYGCWMSRPTRWIEVVDANPGKQKLAVRRTRYPATGGSHEVMWFAYYAAVAQLRSWYTDAYANTATSAVQGNNSWLIETRNDVNYDPAAAFKMYQEIDASLDYTKLPGSLVGKFRTMYDVAHSFIHFGKSVATDLKLATDVVAPVPLRIDWTKQYVTSHRLAAIGTFAESHYPIIEY